VSPEVVLVDLSEMPIFMEQPMRDALSHAETLASLVSEHSIMAGAHLRWSERTYYTVTTDYWQYTVNNIQEFFDRYRFYEDHELYLNENLYGIETAEPSHVRGVVVDEWRALALHGTDMWGFYTEINILHDAELPLERMLVAEENAIEEQLFWFRDALEALNNIDGLQFFILSEVTARGPFGDLGGIHTPFGFYNNDGIWRELAITDTLYEHADIQGFSGSISNVEPSQENMNFFRSQPVNFTGTPAGFIHANQIYPTFLLQRHFDRWFEPGTSVVSTVYLAFTQESVDARGIISSEARAAYIADMSIIGVSAILILGLIVVLLIGAGREYKLVDGVKMRSEIRFHFLDKIYLDLGLAMLIGWTVFIGYFSIVLTIHTFNINIHNIVLLHLIFLTVTLLIVPPILFWLMNLAKRIKAGKFWRHTLIYAVLVKLIYRFICYCIRTARSLWSGTKLTGKVAIISSVVIFMLFFTGFIGAEFRFSGPTPVFFTSLIFTAIVAFFLLRYAKRIRTLEQGAQRVCDGDYDTPIEAGGGELGNIANSINSMSDGIHGAVEERLKSERLKTELITNVSHDIRTPLTSIITYTDLLDQEGLDCGRAPEYLDVLKQKSLRLKTLIDELFEAAKAVSGNIDVNLTKLNAGALIKQVLGELESSVQASGLDIRLNLPENIYANADGKLMQRVLENLMSNVFKYSSPTSRVYIDLHEISDHYVRIEIKNVSASELNFDPSELTERFKRGDDSRADGGSGLGLSIVQSFVVAQGGRFDILIDGDLFKAIVTLPKAQ